MLETAPKTQITAELSQQLVDQLNGYLAANLKESPASRDGDKV